MGRNLDGDVSLSVGKMVIVRVSRIHQSITSGQFHYIVIIIYSPTFLTARLSILLQLRRIFAPSRKTPIFWFIIILRVLNALYYTASLISAIFSCNPIRKFWNPLEEGSCINFNGNILASAVFNLCSDVMMLVLPLYATLRLKMVTRRKVSICSVFAVGIL